MTKYLFLLIGALMPVAGKAQDTFPLYSDSIPNSKHTPDEEKTEQRNGKTYSSKITTPTITVFQPNIQKPNNTAIIIFPGGGYRVNAISHEGTDVAKIFNDMGITAFVVKYRIPNEATMQDRTIGPLQDAQQAIMTVRQRAKEWNVDPAKIGIMGFSAGGHLASTAGTHFDSTVIRNPSNISLRPDFMILIYPVISFQDSIYHQGSRGQLLGKDPAKEMLDYFSNELQVTEKTPPTFLVHASDDEGVKPENSIRFYQALIRNHVPAELHLYQAGGHGFGLNNKTTEDQWIERCKNWLKANRWLN